MNQDFNKDNFVGLDISSKTIVKKSKKSAIVRLDLDILWKKRLKKLLFLLVQLWKRISNGMKQ